MDDVGNIDSFFNVIYGDRAMRLADFEKAKSYYQKAQNFSGIHEGITKDIIRKPVTMKSWFMTERTMMVSIISRI